MFGAYRRNHMETIPKIASKSISVASVSTQGPDSPREYQSEFVALPCKEKSELCKKFTEFGYCPYEKKCKFAHGFHELRKNNTTNGKYKTKECVTFSKDLVCNYGSRCNFIHKKREPENVFL